jgi:putative phage-type endonuclease
MEIIIVNIVTEHPEYIVCPNYEELVTKLVKKEIAYKDVTEEDIKICLHNLNLERCCPSYPSTQHVSEDHIKYLENKPQPGQHTPEWYIFRHSHITASNAWKAFGTQSSKNQLIYEKCKPVPEYNPETRHVNLSETAMTWGHKYEPLTRMIYEDINQTKIQDFGCIEHNEYSFLAASPDGIVVGPNNYGRMIEIKNVVSREISGIPKLDYYIQTLLQMEVCDLNECDFVETKFTEFDSYSDFINDMTDNRKGIIMVYVYNGEYKYYYMPFDITSEENINEWLDENMKYEGEWIKNVYWKLNMYSCVLIKRKPEWFKYAIVHLNEIWQTICVERMGDYSARAPRKRNIKININKNDNIN